MKQQKMSDTRRRGQHGFTLMELLVVLAILGLLMALVGPNVLRQLGGAKTKTAGIQIKDLEQAAEILLDDLVGREVHAAVVGQDAPGAEEVPARVLGQRALLLNAGFDVEVPFVPGRTDALLEQTDVESFAVPAVATAGGCLPGSL